jgi:hypothetical protein
VADRVAEIAERLYGLPLEEFTPERDAAAKELRRAKERDAATAVGKLPKPSAGGWALNTLARESPELRDELLAAGDALREAQSAALAGKGAKTLREATARERAAVDATLDAAAKLKPAGKPLSGATLDRLRRTLHAAAGDEAVRAAIAEGRLVGDAEGGGAWPFDADEQEQAEPPQAKATKGMARGGATKARGGGAKARGGATKARGGATKARGGATKARGAGTKARGGGTKARGAGTKGRGGGDEAAEQAAAEREAAEKAAAAQEAAARRAAEREAAARRKEVEARLAEARTERRAREREVARAEREAGRAAERLERALAAAEEARDHAEEAQAELAAAREACGKARDVAARLEEQLD